MDTLLKTLSSGEKVISTTDWQAGNTNQHLNFVAFYFNTKKIGKILSKYYFLGIPCRINISVIFY